MEVYISIILDVVTRWKWVVSFMTRPLYFQRKSPRFPLDKRQGGPQTRSGRCGRKSLWALPGIEL
jgi:hypothetical protein